MSANATKDAGMVAVTQKIQEAQAIVESKRRIDATVEIWKGIPAMVGGNSGKAAAIKKSMIEGGMLDDIEILSRVHRGEEDPQIRRHITDKLNMMMNGEYAGIIVGSDSEKKIKERQMKVISEIYDLDTLRKLYQGEKDPELRMAISQQIGVSINDEYSGGPQAAAKKLIRKTTAINDSREYPDSEEMKFLMDSKAS